MNDHKVTNARRRKKSKSQISARLAIDIETTGLKGYNGIIWMLSVTENGKTTVLHDCNGKTKYFASYKAKLENPKVEKIVHNFEFDGPYIELVTTQRKEIAAAFDKAARIQIKMDQLFFGTGIRIRNIWDTYLAETVIQGTQIPRGSKDEALKYEHSASLQYVLPRYGFPEPDKSVRSSFIDRPLGEPFTKKDITYAADDTKNLEAIRNVQEYLLTRDGGLEVALLENKVVEVVAQMKVRGLGVDTVLWNKIADENEKKYNKLLRELDRKIAPAVVDNWNSPPQVKKYFYSKGILIKTFDDLEKISLATNDPDLKLFCTARELYSDVTAYGKGWLLDKETGESVLDSDGRMRVQWQQNLNTGRFATSPNLLALPKDGNQRAAIVPAKGHLFVIGDYSGQEIGIMAAASKEDLWINALLRGDSVHALTASLIFSSEWKATTKKGCTFPKKCNCPGHDPLYNRAKIINFMLAYGGGPKKYAEKTGCDEATARKVVRAHKRAIRKLTRYLERNGQTALRTGVAYSADPYKRKFILKGAEDWQIVNQGKNYPIQGAGANMLKLAMISMPEQYPVVLPFHDELVLEVPDRDARKAAVVMKQIMEQSADYITGITGIIKVEPRIAKNFLKPKK